MSPYARTEAGDAVLNFDLSAQFDILLDIEKFSHTQFCITNQVHVVIFFLAEDSLNNTFCLRVRKMIANKAWTADKEKRMHERYNCEAIIKWSYFNKDRFFEAKIFNFSRNGIYFETPHEVKPGAIVFIRLETLLSKNMGLDDHECLRTVTLGEIKWCNELPADGVSYFGVGVRHCEVR